MTLYSRSNTRSIDEGGGRSNAYSIPIPRDLLGVSCRGSLESALSTSAWDVFCLARGFHYQFDAPRSSERSSDGCGVGFNTPNRETDPPMPYTIESIDVFVRETPPGRMAFSLGKQGNGPASNAAITSPLAHLRLMLRDSAGNSTFGCSADRLSVRWLDKRPGRSRKLKLRELATLIEDASKIYLESPSFESCFQQWRSCHRQIMRAGRASGQEDLTSAFASALLERALIDALSRIQQRSVFEMVKQDRLGMRPGDVHRELAGFPCVASLRDRPLTVFQIRHTVGLADPLTSEDLLSSNRVNDGLPETLEEYVAADGIRFFKVKISGDPDADFRRLARIWDVVLHANLPTITLDANEAYDDPERLLAFIHRCDNELTGLFQHVQYIEQPLPRGLTLDATTARSIERISEIKPLIIDEADGAIDAFKRARAIGHRGTSHKNCKGFFKSLLNHALIAQMHQAGQEGILSAEDLQNLPVVPLHQDFAALALLGLTHCERNGHHYNFGLSFLSQRDKENVTRHHPDMYVRRGEEWFLNIQRGQVDCRSLQCIGFGVHDEPDWASMQRLRDWVS